MLGMGIQSRVEWLPARNRRSSPLSGRAERVIVMEQEWRAKFASANEKPGRRRRIMGGADRNNTCGGQIQSHQDFTRRGRCLRLSQNRAPLLPGRARMVGLELGELGSEIVPVVGPDGTVAGTPPDARATCRFRLYALHRREEMVESRIDIRALVAGRVGFLCT